MKLLRLIPMLLILTLYSSNAYSAENCDEIKGNIVAKLFCKTKSGHDAVSSSSDTSTTTEKKNGILSKIWKKPEWMKKKN